MPVPTETVVEVSARDLTSSGELYCPNPLAGMQLWNGHPRVYLEVGKSPDGARCPYCGTIYRLKAGEVLAHGH